MGPEGRPPLHEASARGDAPLVKLLLTGAPPHAAKAAAAPARPAGSLACVNSAGRGGWTALGLASRAGHVACAEAP